MLRLDRILRFVKGNDRHRSKFRSRDRNRDNEISFHPSQSRLRTDIPDLRATKTDVRRSFFPRRRKRPPWPLPLDWLGTAAGAAAVEALVAGSVADHDRSAVRA